MTDLHTRQVRGAEILLGIWTGACHACLQLVPARRPSPPDST
jgi:hypothetical protein